MSKIDVKEEFPITKKEVRAYEVEKVYIVMVKAKVYAESENEAIEAFDSGVVSEEYGNETVGFENRDQEYIDDLETESQISDIEITEVVEWQGGTIENRPTDVVGERNPITLYSIYDEDYVDESDAIERQNELDEDLNGSE